MSVLRCYSQKKTGFDVEARGLLGALRDQLGIRGLESVVILNRYDADQIDPAIYEQAKGIVFSEPQVDAVYDETFPVPEYPHRILAVEALPGQFDQRAASAVECVRLIDPEAAVRIRSGRLLLFDRPLSPEGMEAVRRYCINAVECREKELAVLREADEAASEPVPVLAGFRRMEAPERAAYLSLIHI